MRHIIILTLILLSTIKPYNVLPNDKIDMILVEKYERTLKLIKNGKTIKNYKIDLGFDPIGHKFSEGDGRTPEGLYYLSSKVTNSNFYISYKISYPNKWDIKNAKNINKNPGGYIMVHGHPKEKKEIKDWTDGCIALSNQDMAELDKLIKINTPIFIRK
tara:strand:- start:27940 stop:28416 length:477 start_codon:yes stop_codon:yes gene_type:complete